MTIACFFFSTSVALFPPPLTNGGGGRDINSLLRDIESECCVAVLVVGVACVIMACKSGSCCDMTCKKYPNLDRPQLPKGLQLLPAQVLVCWKLWRNRHRLNNKRARGLCSLLLWKRDYYSRGWICGDGRILALA